MTEQPLVRFGYPTTPRDAALEKFIREFAAQEMSSERIEAWADRVAAVVLEGAPELAAEPELAALLLETAREQWQTFVSTVLTAEVGADVPFHFVPSAARVATEMARRRLDLSVLVTAYRLAQRSSWEYATGVVASMPEDLDHAALLVRFWSAAGSWLDAALEHSIVLHQAETRRIQQRGEAQRHDVVRGLLAGESIEARELAIGLGGYALTGTHVAAVLTARDAGAVDTLEAVVARLSEKLGPGRPLVVHPGGRDLWCWFPVAPATASARVAGLPTDIAPADSVRISLGGPSAGLTGFVAAHEEAVLAQRVALVERRDVAVTWYEDVAAVALLAGDPAAPAFVRRILGGLASDEPAVARLRTTLAAYVAAAGSVAAVAEAHGVHKNTVRYRLDQAEKLLGVPLEGRAVEVGLALAYVEALGQPG